MTENDYSNDNPYGYEVDDNIADDDHVGFANKWKQFLPPEIVIRWIQRSCFLFPFLLDDDGDDYRGDDTDDDCDDADGQYPDDQETMTMVCFRTA